MGGVTTHVTLVTLGILFGVRMAKSQSTPCIALEITPKLIA